MKEIKDFFEEIEKLEIAQGVIDINEAKRPVSEAYVAGINFQANQTKQGGKKMKVVAMLLMLVGLCSCVNRGPVATITTEIGIPMRVTEFTYKGHSYIWFSKSSGRSGIVHNPDCRCNKK